MPKTKAQKQEIVRSLKKNLEKQKGIIFVDVQGLKGRESSELRRQLKKEGAAMTVAKKTLLERALKEEKIEDIQEEFTGEIGAVFAFEDAITALKTVYNFSRLKEHPKIVAGYLDHKFQNAKTLLEIVRLPSREQLYGMLTGTLASPLGGLANVLAGNIKGLVRVLRALGKGREAS